MPREEEIKQQAEIYTGPFRKLPDCTDMHVFNAFVYGARWADRHPAQSPWISISERKPEPKRRVLFLDKDGIAHLGYNNVGGETCTLYMNTEIEIPTVTHWMPIPSLN